MAKKNDDEKGARFTTGVNIGPDENHEEERRFEEGDRVPDDLTKKQRAALKDAIEEG